MYQNMGNIDRIIRILVGAVLINLTFIGVLPVWGYIGVVPMLTAMIGWCPAYLPFGIKTCKTPK